MEIKQGAHIHFIGICGTAMASLAGLLNQRGFKITGSDSNPYPPMSTQIEALGITIMKGYKKENLENTPDFVIVGNVVSSNNPEAEEVARKKIPHTSLAKAMGEWIIADRQCVNISGTHGKTTTTGLMSWILDQAGEKPGFLIGGIPNNFPTSFRNPEGMYFVIEGDEYDTAYFDKVPKFIHYKPRHVIFTSCEFDHIDIYPNFDSVKSAFLKLMNLIPEDGTLVYWAENEDVTQLASQAKVRKKISYGLKTGDFVAQEISFFENQTRFSVLRKKEDSSIENLGVFQIQLPGDYNVLNALAAIALSLAIGIPITKVKAALETYKGVKRRQEILGTPNDIMIIEDFAHHPTAVSLTIDGIKKRYPNRKLFCVFEPRSATSRRRVFQDEYVKSFKNADVVAIMKAFDQSKIDVKDRFSSDELVTDLVTNGVSATVFESVDMIVEFIKVKAKPTDCILLMSNGGFDGIYQKLLSALS